LAISDRRRLWLLVGAVVAAVIVAGTVAGVVISGSDRSGADGLVRQTPDIRGAVETVMPPEMRSALGSSSMRQQWKPLTLALPYGETNWAYSWALNDYGNFHLNPSGTTYSRGLGVVVSTYRTEKEAAQSFRTYEKGGNLLVGGASCGAASDECHYYGARPAMGDASFDLSLSVSLQVDTPRLGYVGRLGREGVVVGARFRNVAVYVSWYGVDVPRGKYPAGIINKGTPLDYSVALPQGIAYVKAVLERI
jgi:hypothetical protein